jgi:trehalose 6-phosphate synthase/phosphatase
MDKSAYSQIIEKYRTSKNKIVLLDYDGTLVNYSLVPDRATLNEHKAAVLAKLAGSIGTVVYLITGRSFLSIDKLLGHLPVNIIADHGAIMKENDNWTYQYHDDNSWKKKIMPVLASFTTIYSKSYVEEKSFSLAWHYRNVESRSGVSGSRELIKILQKEIAANNLKILDGNRVVEILPGEVGKGKAVQKLFEQNNYDFILSIGDDATDEEMFEYLLHINGAYTVRVGRGQSLARYKLKGINEVIILLEQLSR